MGFACNESTLQLLVELPDKGEFAHPNVIYSMEIDANMRRLSVGAALSEATLV